MTVMSCKIVGPDNFSTLAQWSERRPTIGRRYLDRNQDKLHSFFFFLLNASLNVYQPQRILLKATARL